MINRLKYEHKSLRTLRRAGGSTRSKLEQDGWEVVAEEPGKLRTTLTLRRARTPVGWLKIGGPVVAVVVIIAVVAVGAATEDDGPASEADYYSGKTGGDPDSDEDSEPTGSITPENNEEFAALLAGPERGPSVAAFIDQYRDEDRRFEFDGFVVMVYNADYNTEDAIIQAGTPAAPTGPRFAIGELYPSRLAGKIERLKEGQAIHVSGLLGIYEHDDSHDTFTNETKLMKVYLVETQFEVR
jgi:hypothetical protein